MYEFTDNFSTTATYENNFDVIVDMCNSFKTG